MNPRAVLAPEEGEGEAEPEQVPVEGDQAGNEENEIRSCFQV